MVKWLLIWLIPLNTLLQLLGFDSSEVVLQVLPAVGQVLLFETLSMEIWIAEAIPIGSLWLRWVGSSFTLGCCFLTAEMEQSHRKRGDGEKIVSAMEGLWWTGLSSLRLAISLVWLPQKLKQVAASVSVCLTRTEGYYLTSCGPFDLLLPCTGKTSTVTWIKLLHS